MNGDIGKVYKVVNDIDKRLTVKEAVDEERHQENKEHLERIDNTLLDFQKNGAGPNPGHTIDIRRLYIWVWAIAIGIILTAIKAIAG